MQKHLINATDDLINQWITEWHNESLSESSQYLRTLLNKAVHWGADQQLELDAAWVTHQGSNLMSGKRLKAAMRPSSK
jgi:hypothetical protein